MSLASNYSITSSASVSEVGGGSGPRAFALFRSRGKSNFVGASYGDSSPGAGAVHHIIRGLTHCSKNSCLFNHLVGAAEQRKRESDAEAGNNIKAD